MLNLFLRRATVAGASALAIGFASPAALACSTCKCGDYTITLFGTEKAYDGRLRVGLDYLYRSETAGAAGPTRQNTEEQRATLGLAYSFSPDLTVALQLPFVRKEVTTANLAREEAEGMGDVDLTARWTLYRSGAVSGRHLAGVRGGLRLPTSEEVRGPNGQKVSIDAQPDAGATVPSIGGWYGYYRFPWFASLSTTYFHYGEEGNQDFRGGDVWLVSALGQYGLTQTLALQFGVDMRQSEKNRFSGVEDPDSGGFLAMGFVGAALRIGEDLLLHAGGQATLVENLNGEQDEDPALRLGMTYDF